MTKEPNFEFDKKTFPYQPPSDEVKSRYASYFIEDVSIRSRACKRIIDVLAGSIFCLLSIIPLSIIFIAYKIEAIFYPENGGPTFYFYWAVSNGELIKKWKIRQIKIGNIDVSAASRNDWRAFSGEWDETARTFTGAFVKKWYLDELPQFFSVVRGDISLVGPRPLSREHYDRDLAQGNVTRKLLKGGMLGLGHIQKGTALMGESSFEYEYLEIYDRSNCAHLLKTDFFIIKKGIALILRGGGH